MTSLSSTKNGFFFVIVMCTIFVVLFFTNFHIVLDKPISPHSMSFRGNQISDPIHLQRQTLSSKNKASRLNETDLHIDTNFTLTTEQLSDFWEKVDAMITNDSLYSEKFNVSSVLNVMRHSKLVMADLFPVRNSYKWTLYLQGGQRILFKPKLV